MRCRLAVSMKSGGAVLAPDGLQQFGGNQEEGGSGMLQEFVNGRLRARAFVLTVAHQGLLLERFWCQHLP